MDVLPLKHYLFIYFIFLIYWFIKLYCNSGLVFWILGEKWGEQTLPITWDRHWWHFQVHASTEKEEVSTIQRRRQHHQLITFLFVFWSFLHVLVALIFIYLYLRYAAISISENEDGKLIIKCSCEFFFTSRRYEYISSFQAPLMKWKKWRVWILWEGTGATSQRMLGSKRLFHQLNRLFPIPKTLYFEVRLGVKPLMWKWVKFTWELKIMFMLMVSLLASLWNRGLR